MNPFQKWLQSASPLAKTFMAISITSAVVVVHKWFYAPYARRVRYRQAEEWANAIIEKEEQNGDTQGTNISY